MKGGGQKVRYIPRNQGNQTFLGGISRDFAGISRRYPKSLRKKKLVFTFWPLTAYSNQSTSKRFMQGTARDDYKVVWRFAS